MTETKTQDQLAAEVVTAAAARDAAAAVLDETGRAFNKAQSDFDEADASAQAAYQAHAQSFSDLGILSPYTNDGVNRIRPMTSEEIEQLQQAQAEKVQAEADAKAQAEADAAAKQKEFDDAVEAAVAKLMAGKS